MNPVETPSRKNFKGSGLDFYSPRSASQTPSHGGGGHRRRWKNSSQAIDSMEDLDVPAFVIDNGSGFLKAGYGTEDRPQVIVGTQRIGRLRGALKLSYPTNAGVVSNWEHVQKLWENAYEEQRVSPRNHPLLMTEQPLCLMKHRITTAEILYETMEVPSMCFQLPQVLGLYAVGNTTGLMVDSGDTLSSAVPIFDGRYDPNTVCVTNLAGRDVTQYLSRLLRLAGWNMTSSSEMEEVKRIKQKQCATAFNLASALRDYEDTGIGYKLPDGRVIKIGLEKFEAPELMFQPSLMGKENPGIHELVCNAISKCKTEHRRHIARQVILTGGNTTFKGFEYRLMTSVKKLRKISGMTFKAPERRVELAWAGGAVLSTLSLFKGMCTTKEEFLEYGAQVYYKKRAQDGVTEALV